MIVPSTRAAQLLERNQSKRVIALSCERWFFLEEKPLGLRAFGIYLLWFRCIGAHVKLAYR